MQPSVPLPLSLPLLPLLPSSLLQQARQRIRQVSLFLVHTWRPTIGGSSSRITDSKHSDNGGVQEARAAAAAAAVVDGSELGVPGVFPGTLLQARDKETGQPLSDEHVSELEGVCLEGGGQGAGKGGGAGV